MTYTLKYGNTKNYWTNKTGLWLDYQGFSRQPMAIWGAAKGVGEMNDAGKALIYPKANIHPIKADFSIYGKSTVNNPKIDISIDDVSVFNESYTVNSRTDELKTKLGATDSAILNSTNASTITITLTSSNTSLVGGFGVRDDSYIKFYYQMWDLRSEAVGNGIRSVTQPGRIYTGETGTFKATCKRFSTWHGWYLDAGHTQLYSEDQSITVTATQDLTLYAWAEQDLPDTYSNTYFKSEIAQNKWIKPLYAYQKTLDGWKQISESDLPKSGNWQFSNSYTEKKILSEISSISVRYVAQPYRRPLFYIRNDISYLRFASWSVSGNNTNLFVLYNYDDMDTVMVAVDPGWVEDYNTITIHYNGYDANNNFVEKTISIQAKCNEGSTYTIHFFDKDGNEFTEQPDSNEAYMVTTPAGYENFIGWEEYYNSKPTGRICTVGNSYYDMGHTRAIYYLPVFSS